MLLLSSTLIISLTTGCGVNKNITLPHDTELDNPQSQPPVSQTDGKDSDIQLNPYNTFTASDDSATYYIGRKGLFKLPNGDQSPLLLDSLEAGSKIALSDTHIYYNAFF